MHEALQSVARRVMLKAFLTGTVTPATGKTIPVTLSKAGAAFGNPSAGATNATELASGWYYVDLSTTDFNTLGDLIVRGAEGTIDATERLFSVVAATNRGMTNLDATVSSRASQTSVDTIDDFLDTEVAAILAAVDTEVAALVSELAKVPKSDSTVTWNATALASIQTEATDALTTALTEGYRSHGATGSAAQLLYEILAATTNFSIASTTKTAKKIDGSTTAKTYTLNSATTPTSVVHAS